jgi:hypothetical protein
MIYMCIKYRVRDFLKWHEAFMRNEELRIAAGINVENILRNHKDKNYLTILYAVDSIVESENFIKEATRDEMRKELTIDSEVTVEYFDVFY